MSYFSLVQTFLYLCSLWNSFCDKMREIYEINPNLKKVVDVLITGYNHTYCILTGQKKEKTELPWLSYSWIEPNDYSLTDEYSYQEKFHNFFATVIGNSLLSDQLEYARMCISMMSLNTKSSEEHPLIIFKAEDECEDPFYIVRIGKREITKLTYDKSPAKFLLVEYIHPQMEEAIEIKVSTEWCVIGNELFSPTFVLRALQYQSKFYVFDNMYTIRLMTETCEQYELGADMYVRINETGFEVVKT